MAATKSNRIYKFMMRKPLECSNGRNNICVPKDYVFSAKVRSYQAHGKELNDFEIQPDGKVFLEETYFNEVGCDHVRFVD